MWSVLPLKEKALVFPVDIITLAQPHLMGAGASNSTKSTNSTEKSTLKKASKIKGFKNFPLQ